LPQQTAARLHDAGAALETIPVLVGFDGFIDTIYHAVDTRQSATEYTRIETLEAFGRRIVAAAGKSTNVEIVPQNVKLGGNGPIMAFALSCLGAPLTYCGMTGYPHTHEVFAEFARRAQLLPISEPALTDAYEFDDGKLIVGKHATVAEVSYDNIMQRVGDSQWRAAWENARCVGMVNWTMLPHLTDLWKRLLLDDGARPQTRKTLFFDLADPEKRTEQDLHEALDTIAAFQQSHDVILGLNEKESLQVADALAVPITFSESMAQGETSPEMIVELAAAIRARLGIHTCVVHPTRYAAGADATGASMVPGPFIANPKISTGAGDHFNAGFCAGHLIGCDLAQSLQLGVATSGYYVRHAASPNREQLGEFLRSL